MIKIMKLWQPLKHCCNKQQNFLIKITLIILFSPLSALYGQTETTVKN